MCVHLPWGISAREEQELSISTHTWNALFLYTTMSWSCIGTPQLGESGRKGKVTLNCPQNASVEKSEARWNLCVLEHARA